MVRIVGPSYTLDTRKADCQRTVNMYPKTVESGAGKSEYVLEEIPGLTVFADLASGPIRGCYSTTRGASYWVAGSAAFKLLADGTSTNLGSLATSVGHVEMAANAEQLGIVDGPNGYYVTLADDTFGRISSSAFYGSKTIDVIDGYALFTRPDTGQFYIADVNDINSLDALDFATAEGSPDNLVAVIADHRIARLFGTHTTEGWFDVGNGADMPFSRDQSSFSQVGSSAPHSIRLVANSLMFIGQNAEGNGIVYMTTGNDIQRVSTHAIEEMLRESTDIDESRAYTYQDGGHLFYCLNVPGLDTTLCFDASTRAWHDRAELVDGEYAQHRATCHTHAFGLHLLGADDGKVYKFDRNVFTNDGDPLVRDRITPHSANPSIVRQFFGTFELDASAGDAAVGVTPVVQLRYSNDGGKTWSTWRARELGQIGRHGKRVRWLMNGSGLDRVWHLRTIANAPYSVIRAVCAARDGNA